MTLLNSSSSSSIGSFFTGIEGWFVETEQDVLKIISEGTTVAEAAASQVNAALKWLAGQTPTIAADLQFALSIASQVGVAGNPKVAAAIEAANLAVTGLNALASSINSGENDVQAVANGYSAVKQAQAAATAAQAAAATAAASTVPAVTVTATAAK